MEKDVQDDGDYMSDEFLKELKDVRPGLLSKEAKRKTKVFCFIDLLSYTFLWQSERMPAPDLPKTKKIKVLEEEAREKGLSVPISSDNKGFAMLQKMGYKKGTALGKSSDGEASPIPIVMRDGKTGLGRKAFVAEKKSEGKVQEAVKFSNFRSRKQISLSQVKIKSDLRKSQLSCQRLDTRHGLTAPLMRWYWPEEAIPQTDEEKDYDSDEELDMEPVEQLESVTAYLRANYFYCVWCGTEYQDEADMHTHCPGDNEEAHE